MGEEEGGFEAGGEVVVVVVAAVAAFSLVGRGGWEPLMKALKCLFAIFDMSAQRAVRGLQSLTGRLRTSLDSRYLS